MSKKLPRDHCDRSKTATEMVLNHTDGRTSSKNTLDDRIRDNQMAIELKIDFYKRECGGD